MNTVYWVLVAFGIVVLEARLRARNVRYLPILPAIVLGAVLSKVTYVVLQWHYAFPRWSWGASRASPAWNPWCPNFLHAAPPEPPPPGRRRDTFIVPPPITAHE